MSRTALIRSGPPSKRMPVYSAQARVLAACIRALDVDCKREFGRHYAVADYHELGRLWPLPSYRLFIDAAEACGFVCTDFRPKLPFGFGEVNEAVEAALGQIPFPKLRLYVHTLVRAERWADSYSSPILEALASGALQLVAKRLESDASFYEDESGMPSLFVASEGE